MIKPADLFYNTIQYYMVKLANENDITALNILVNSAYRDESSKQGWTTEAGILDGIRTDEASLKEMMLQSSSFILKYEEDNKITGCVYLRKEKDKMYLGMLTVSPLIQNKGIGKILLSASEDEACKRNCNSIFMSVISIRTELINWYKKYGYYDTGIKKPFPENDPRFGIPKTHLEFIILEKSIC
ncbi:MAG TPA: GNAT family N-acetyltransferase [Parafilimonas sp.]